MIDPRGPRALLALIVTLLFFFCERSVSAQYTISTLAGGGQSTPTFDGIGVAVDAAGAVYATAIIASGSGSAPAILKLTSPSTTTVVGGGMNFPGCGQAANNTGLTDLGGVAVDNAGNVFLAQAGNAPVLMVSGGTVTCLANAKYYWGYGVVGDNAGGAYFSSNGDFSVYHATAGPATRVAGNGQSGCTGGGLGNPYGLALDNSGTLYIADAGCNVIWKAGPSGITRVAGTGSPGFTGDGSLATNASLNEPHGIAVDASGTLYIADYANNRIRQVKGGIITTIAGNGTPGLLDAYPATNAELDKPYSIAVGPHGIVYFGDSNNRLIRQLMPAAPVTITEVDNGFSNVPNSPIQSGSWVVIKGTNLSTNPGRGWNATESFPSTMDGTSVSINNKAAFLYYISPTQVNLQAPSDAALGPVSVIVTSNGVSSGAATAQYQSNAPALLQWNGGQYPYAIIQRGSTFIGNPAVVPGTVSASAGDILTLWATGLGTTNPAVPAGQQPTTFPPVTATPTVTVGGVNVTVLGAVLRYAGLYQVNIQLPTSLPSGDQPVKVIQGSFQSPDGVLINIQP